MRTTVALPLALLALLALGAGSSRADPYPWCAVYGSGDGLEATNCGFETLKQCQDTISGIGGQCERNLRYTGPERQPAKPAKPKAPKTH